MTYQTPYILTEAGRYADLMKQGVMKPLPKPRTAKAKPVFVACSGCCNWHYKGKHTATVDERRVNRKRLGCAFKDEQR
jgi:hypothetical protein